MTQRTLTRAVSLARRVVRLARRQQAGRPEADGSTRARRRGPSGSRAPGATPAYAGDFTGTPPITYEPVMDDLADPGEVVWTWVPYEEDHTRGKDRPVLVIGRHDGRLLALQLTSQDHDGEDEARRGRYWVEVGSGAWDRQRRPSEARVDRVLQLDPEGVRRIGAVLPREVFDHVAEQVRRRV